MYYEDVEGKKVYTLKVRVVGGGGGGVMYYRTATSREESLHAESERGRGRGAAR